MLHLRLPWQESPAERNAERDKNLVKALEDAEGLLQNAVEALQRQREAIANPEFWSEPGTVGRGLVNGRARVVAEAVAKAQREVWQSSEYLVAAVSLAGGYEVEEES